jgi:8-oxo-dGTP pyrophosphatase MutT (NUDIX family)
MRPEAETAAAPESDWYARLRRGLLPAPDHRAEAARCAGLAPDRLGQFQLTAQRLRACLPAVLQPAAVLVPIIERAAAPTLLFTVRASHLRHHAGQISFPGGRLEAGDADVAATALRETAEETGIDRSFIQPLGFLADHLVMTGYRITPVVALLRSGFTLRPDSTEVAGVFELPLAYALESSNYRTRRRVLGDLEIDGWELPYGDFNIWGATAGMLVHLREAIEGRA